LINFNRYASPTAFTDLLFNIVIGVAFMFMLAFLLINPVAKKQDIESKADFLIILNWDTKSFNDLDLWMRDPLENTVSFRNKDNGLMHLDRDDLGGKNDRIKQPDGTIKYVALNREILALRGTVEGWYVVNIHSYRKRDEPNPVKGSVELIQVNPYKVIAIQDFEIQLQGIEKTIWQFEMDDTGNIVDIKEEPYSIVKLALASLSGYWDIREEEEW
jgi:hypothetical protein|tara:strand:+ start:4263 stop:4910 length:648 start_codon:yes stop_codon:yes gene_type:complete